MYAIRSYYAFAVCLGLIYSSLRTLSRSLGPLAQLHNVLERIEKLLGMPVDNLWVGTFHGLAHRNNFV